jgi:uncharacterized damage-inducible protein DinB
MDIRYPIGKFHFEGPLSRSQRQEYIDDIAGTPALLKTAVHGLSQVQIDTSYREGGWTVRQVVHHLPDSHINSYIRFRLALTEDQPTVKPYKEDLWAELADAKSSPIEVSLTLLTALHERWAVLLRSMGDAEFARTFRHPDMGVVTLERTVALYSWHGRHHVAQITSLRQRKGW